MRRILQTMNTITNITAPAVFDDDDADERARARELELRQAWLDGTIPDPGPPRHRAAAVERLPDVCHGPRVRVASWRERWTGRRC